MIPYIACVLLFLIGLFVVISKRNLIKIVIGFSLIERSLVSSAGRWRQSLQHLNR